MSADSPVHPSSPADPAAPAPAPRQSGSGVLQTLSLVVALAALVMASMLWQKLEQTQRALAEQSAESADDAKSARQSASQTDALAQELAARLTVAEVRLSEVSLQRSQLEELMISVSRSRDDHLVQELESTLQLAQQQVQVTGSAQVLISALQSADQRISRAAQPRLNPVQRAIARDIERIRSAAATDIPALAMRLDEMSKLIDELPLANAAPRPGVRRTPAPALPASTAPAPQEGVRGVVGRPLEEAGVPPAQTPPEATGPDSASAASTGSLWPAVLEPWRQQAIAALRRWWGGVDASARDLVRISRIDQPEALLIAPDQAQMLRHNLKMQLLNARLALLSRQIPVAQVDVLATTTAVRRYFDPQASATRATLRALEQIQSEMKTTDVPRPTETLAALATAGAGR